MDGALLSDGEFRELLDSFRESAFYLEAQHTYALDYEAADLERFLAGSPAPPSEIEWWRPWLEQIASLTQEGKQVSRVRVVSEPLSGYQRWELWALPWHTEAGEQISYLSRGKAESIGLPLEHDWWLLDDERVILLTYNDDGHITGKMLVTDSGIIARHCAWRDLAVRNAIPAAEVIAA